MALRNWHTDVLVAENCFEDLKTPQKVYSSRKLAEDFKSGLRYGRGWSEVCDISDQNSDKNKNLTLERQYFEFANKNAPYRNRNRKKLDGVA